jgi:NAD(P)-dependent dehydrogenase (short-subunit alcohol dehydrogenase family)
MKLEKQIAIVTGGGQGIGQQICLRLAEEGATVVIADINEKGSMDTAEMIVKKGGAKAKVIPTDITHEDQVERLAKETLEIENRIDILVNNSGIAGPVKNIEDITVEEWEATMAVNVRGMFLCCKHVIPAMKKQGKGSIVNISSITGKRHLVQRTPYATSKMAVMGLTRTLAAEVGKWKIRVNTICPGGIMGPRFDFVVDSVMKSTGKTREQVITQFTEESALRSLVDPKYIASTVAFLCSDDAAMIAGQDINVDAGTVMY